MRLPPQQARHSSSFWDRDERKGARGAPFLLLAMPSPRGAGRGYSVISWIRVVSSGFGGPLWSAMALVMSPWSLILPAMKACMAA